MSKREVAHKGAGWFGLVIALFGLAEGWMARDAARLESRQDAAHAAAYAKVDAIDEVDGRLLTLTASVATTSERTRWLARSIERLEERLQRRRRPRPRGYTPASRPIVMPAPIVPDRPAKLPKADRVEAQRDLYIQQAF